MLRHATRWVWDSWTVTDGADHHLFYLQAPRSLADPRKRHLAATIGHAVSRDLVDWAVQPDALLTDPGGWDDLALWTGSVVRGDDGRWRMFYTGISSRGRGVNDQRIGLAVSDDLVAWRRPLDAPLLHVDPRWYKHEPGAADSSRTWRDPHVFRDPGGDGWHMIWTAAARDAPPYDDGVLGHALSHDLLDWQVCPPLSEPGAGFGQLEVPQVNLVDGHPVLTFTCHPNEQTPERVAASGLACTWSVTGDSLTGPWDVSRAQPFTAEPYLFAAPMLQRVDGAWVLLGFRNTEDLGHVALEILDPIPVDLSGDRLVAVARDHDRAVGDG